MIDFMTIVIDGIKNSQVPVILCTFSVNNLYRCSYNYIYTKFILNIKGRSSFELEVLIKMTALTLKMDTQCQFINFITWCYIYCVNHFCPKLLEMAKFCFLKWLLNELYLWLDLIDWFVQKTFLIWFCQSLSSHEINDIQCMFIMDVLFIVNCTY